MENQKSLVSIIIPVYNSEKTIRKCLDSILCQTFKDFTVYIINDGSTDNSSSILNEYNKLTNIKVINQSNLGVSAARNRALDMIHSKFVTFIDSDDYVNPKFLEHLVEGFADNDVDLVTTGVTYISDEGILLQKSKYKSGIYDSNKMLSYVLEEGGPQGYLCNKLFKTKIIQKNNIRLDYDIYMAEDLVFCVQYILYANKINILKSRDYFYVQFKNSLSHQVKNNNIEAYKNYMLALNKIKKIIPNQYKQPFVNIRGRICRLNCDIIRNLNLNRYDGLLMKEAKCEAKRYRKYLFKSTDVNNKKICSYYITIYFPWLMKEFDKKYK